MRRRQPAGAGAHQLREQVDSGREWRVRTGARYRRRRSGAVQRGGRGRDVADVRRAVSARRFANWFGADASLRRWLDTIDSHGVRRRREGFEAGARFVGALVDIRLARRGVARVLARQIGAEGDRVSRPRVEVVSAAHAGPTGAREDRFGVAGRARRRRPIDRPPMARNLHLSGAHRSPRRQGACHAPEWLCER